MLEVVMPVVLAGMALAVIVVGLWVMRRNAKAGLTEDDTHGTSGF